MAKITYDDKVALNEEPSVAAINKVSDDDMNEIKTSVNDLYDTVSTNTSNISSNTSSINAMSSYSTTESTIGTWYDGKPIYRSVFNITSPQDSNTNYVDLSNLHINKVVHLYGYYANATGWFGIPFTDSSTNYSVMFVSSGGYLRGRFGNSSNITDAIVVLEYTKTTD